ncbi:MAG: DUF3526 domain-containing protein [Gammaproteobacteria bacterium]|nr:DUF3526 domain-containing protein [Gammaproteobacteria bacterium]MCY4278914.1 DUF3526 domain-containing protein [Gammaproteobacteria bacterium]MCY4322421.1 DUF3526 domain-containing protein [Gammaproteobacteria bacterium]
MTGTMRELQFLAKDRAVLLWLGIALLVTGLSVLLGLREVASERAIISELIDIDRAEREAQRELHRDWGSTAYYTFHLTYDAPSDFAFAALGMRDTSPWKHSIRALALEGQIYETDADNPDFALIGRFDFAFVAAMLAPLLLILLLHDVRSRERAAGRYELLSAVAASPGSPWLVRAALRAVALALCLIVPLVAGGMLADAGASELVLASLIVALHIGFWWGVCALVDRFCWSSPVNLTALIGAWLALAVIAPAVMRSAVESATRLPDGGELMLVQREAVNDAWDLPKSATMEAFVERHPQWAAYTEVSQPFEWKWYYAFQQVGDQTVEPLSHAYREGRIRRDELAAKLAWFSPPTLVTRILQDIAGTSMKDSLDYEQRVRDFHAVLRDYYYPRLFRDEAFTDESLGERPEWSTLPSPGR